MTPTVAAEAVTPLTHLNTGDSGPLAHAAGPLLVLGGYGCGKTVVMKKLLWDAYRADAHAFVFDSLGGGHAYDALLSGPAGGPASGDADPTGASPTTGDDVALYGGQAHLRRALADRTLTHLFFDTIAPHAVPEMVAAWADSRRFGRFAAGAAHAADVIGTPLGHRLLEARPTLFIMRTDDRTVPNGHALRALLVQGGFGAGFLRDLDPGEGLLILEGSAPAAVRFELSDEEMVRFTGQPLSYHRHHNRRRGTER